MLILVGCSCVSTAAQTGEWAWITGSQSGDCTLYECGRVGVFGTLGVPAATNVPGSRWGGAGWIDKAGNLWLFGGYGLDDEGHDAEANDLWEFNPATNLWTWMGGSDQFGENDGPPGVYGTKGVPAAGNVPGGRDSAVSWTDSNGNFWLFGGAGWDETGVWGYLNDLWEYVPSTKEWVWVSGSNTVLGSPQNGVYGELGIPAPGNVPGARQEATGWADASGHLWLFGGDGYANDSANVGDLDDLWEFDPSTTEWTWMGGSDTLSVSAGAFGALGEFAAGNFPGSRTTPSGWTDSSGNFWLLGGFGAAAACPSCAPYGTILDDLWEFDVSKKEWAWMSGDQAPRPGFGSAGVYGTLGTPAPGNIPGSRADAAGWAGDNGNFWVFGGSAVDVNGNQGSLNDFWEFNPRTKEWTWMGGPEDGACARGTCTPAGVFGTRGKPAPGNIPGGRQGATNWTDKRGNLWLFGGYYGQQLNDFWVFQPTPGNLPATTPAFGVASGSYGSTKNVGLTDATAGATIYYTLDGSTPTSKSAKYTIALSIAKNTMVKAIAIATGYEESVVATATYVILKPQTISFTQPTTPVTYGAKPIELAATASSGLAVALKLVSGPAKLSGHTLTFTGAGWVVVAATQAGNGDYSAAAEVKRELKVDRATLSVKANNLSMNQGAAVPTLTYSFVGFVNGDTTTDATTGKPALSTTATSTSPAGSYPIAVKAGTLAAANYKFAFVNGTLTGTQ